MDIGIIGTKFGDWLILKQLPNRGKHKLWLCQCSCSAMHAVYDTNLKSGKTKCCLACGTIKHGGRYTRLYSEWKAMKSRAGKAKYYEHVVVFADWCEFPSFRDWALSNGYTDTLSLDRKDNSKGYEPTNCRWVPLEDQQRNKSNVHISDSGELYLHIAKANGINEKTFYSRIHYGKTPKQASTGKAWSL